MTQDTSRSANSVRNSVFAIGGQAIAMLFGFITRIFFVRYLGEAYLGVNGVFYSVLSLLSLTELGMGSAFTYALYRPIAQKDTEQIGRIMNLYARAYRIVALAVTALGLCLIPFLGYITADVPEVAHITVIYLLFLANAAASYLFSYKRALITAAEQDYRNTINTSVFSILQNLMQLAILLIWNDYVWYLVAQLFCTIVSNLAISRTAGKMFPYLRKIKGLPDKKTNHDILQNIKAMFVNRFGSVAVVGTDNLLIATIDVVLVGFYSNYYLLLGTVQVILQQVTAAVTASVGNLLAGNEGDKKRSVYRDIHFAVAWLYGFSAIALDLLMTRFIGIAFGSGHEIAEAAVHLMCLNFYLNGIRQPNLMYINAAGLFHPMRWKGFAEAAINLLASGLFLWFGWGLNGVLLGTTVSHIATSLWWEPWCVGKYCTGKGTLPGFTGYNAFYGIILLLAWGITAWTVHWFPMNFIGFLPAMVIVAVLPNLFFWLIYRKNKQFAFFKTIAVNLLRKLKRK